MKKDTIHNKEVIILFSYILFGVLVHFILMTPIHELGHVFFAKISGAKVIEVQLWHTWNQSAHVDTDGNFSSALTFILFRIGGQIFYLGTLIPVLIYWRNRFPESYLNYTSQFLLAISFWDVRIDYLGFGLFPRTGATLLMGKLLYFLMILFSILFFTKLGLNLFIDQSPEHYR